MPEGFTERIKKDLGDEADSFLGAFFDAPKRGFRINTLKTDGRTEREIAGGLERIPWEEHGYYYGTSLQDAYASTPGRMPMHSAGAYYIQEPSAMAPVTFLDVRPDMCVLDLCAAPGGKSTQAASYLAGKGLLIANEPVRDRARILSQNIERMGIRNALVLSHDPDELVPRFPASFDRILVDAPCSGEGMFRRDETAVNEWSPENVVMCAKRQERILEAAAVMLKPGGRLVYSTCTFSDEENEEQVRRFLERHGDYRMAAVSPCTGMRAGQGMVRIWPQDGFGEGHFMAVLEREGSLLPGAYGYSGVKEKPLNNRQIQETAPYREFIPDVIKNGAFKSDISDSSDLFMFGSSLCAMPEGGLPCLSGLKVIRAGLELGSIRKGRFMPSHALALAMKPEDAVSVLELPPEGDEAGRYLRGETINAVPDLFSAKEKPARGSGWTLVSLSGISLGWGKISNGILKNHYPKGLRVNTAY
ncbi:MAG: RsmF rRNA methyltransferase first C-terminal domain-containing protein [Lachnospiraceae bacterium]|nr:RsmF rRNA methyltransferase first C-terminal domain-containing protein [Lachnospiraceae bacterium]